MSKGKEGFYFYSKKRGARGYIMPGDEGYEKHKASKAKQTESVKYYPPTEVLETAGKLGKKEMPMPKKKSPVNFDELIKKYSKRKMRGN